MSTPATSSPTTLPGPADAAAAQTKIIAKTTIHACFRVEGFHRWPEAEGQRDYLSSRHRHQFRYKASIDVLHGDREIEFHDFLDWCLENAPKGELGRFSAEQMAQVLLGKMKEQWPGRMCYRVEVWEDEQVGCTVEWLSC